MPGEINKVLTLFDTFKQDVLTFQFNIQGKNAQAYLVDELLCGEDNSTDYDTLRTRLSKLGPVHLFYGVMEMNAEREYASAKDDFDSWYAQVESEVNIKMIEEIQRLDVAAGLKKAPTGSLIKGRVMKDYPALWKEKKEKLEQVEGRKNLLNRMMSSLNATIKLSTTESSLLQAAITRGLEEASPITPSKKLGYSPKPKDEAF